jgi:translocation and assembly module TamB
MATLAGLVLVSVAVLFLALQSSWFKDQVRLKIISVAERATGGRVEIQSFDFDWHQLTAEIHGFILHGTEPTGDPPLFRADRAVVGLKLVSIFRQKVDIDSLRVSQPQVALIVRPDGSTNVPTPKVTADERNLLEQILDLAIRRFELSRGSLSVNAETYPLDIRGEDLNLHAAYDRAGPRYVGTLSSHHLKIASNWDLPSAASVNGRFEFARDHARFDRVIFTLNKSKLELSGTVRHFINPEATGSVIARIDAAELGSFTNYPELKSGMFLFDGSARYQTHTPVVQGALSGTDLSYKGNGIAFDKVAISSQLDAQQDSITLHQLAVEAPDGKFSGEALLQHYRELRITGEVRSLRILQASRFLPLRVNGWDGIASGPVQLTATLAGHLRNVQLTTKVNIVPGSQSIPLSGWMDLDYRQNKNHLQLGDSHLELPHSALDISGTLGETLRLKVNTSDLRDFEPVIALTSADLRRFASPLNLEHGHASFEGTVTGSLGDPSINGKLSLQKVRYGNSLIDQFQGIVGASNDLFTLGSGSITQGSFTATLAGQLGLLNWRPDPNGQLQIHAAIRNADLRTALAQVSAEKMYPFSGVANASLDVTGTLTKPSGTGRLAATDVNAYGEHLDRLATDLAISGDRVTFEKGVLREGDAVAAFGGVYTRSRDSWTAGQLRVHLDANGLSLASLASVRRYEPDVSGKLNLHADATAQTSPRTIRLESINGHALVRQVTIAGVPYGDFSMEASTRGQDLETNFKGNLRDAKLSGTALVGLTGDYPASGAIDFGTIHLTTVRALFPSERIAAMPLDGALQGKLTFSGPLAKWRNMKGSLQLDGVRITPELAQNGHAAARVQDLTLQSASPVRLDFGDQAAVLHQTRLVGKDTQIEASGRLDFSKAGAITASATGTVNLQILQLFDPDLTSGGTSNLKLAVTGTTSAPTLDGTLEFHEASFNMQDFPNGLEHANGVIRFDQNRATIQRLTATTGGGTLALGGFVSFGNGGPVVYRLEASAENVRVRYAGAVSVSFNSALKFTGTAQQSLLSGTLTVTRAAVGGNADIGSLFTSTAGAAALPTSDNDLLRGVQMDVRVESTPSLLLSTSMSQDVQAEIDLRLRGTPNRPVVLGRVSVNEGQIQVFGSKYNISRGEIDFVNSAKIEPVLDLVLETQARGVTVNIAVTGTLNKLNVSYRSDPPLQSSEIIALLAVGRAPDQTSSFVNNPAAPHAGFLSGGTDTILGQAVSPASSRLQRFFGVTHLKIDPQLQGIENVPQARLTIEQQISREITITYVTNLSRTSEQIFRLEWALSRQYSFVAIRDENGLFGVDLQYKRRFK